MRPGRMEAARVDAIRTIIIPSALYISLAPSRLARNRICDPASSYVKRFFRNRAALNRGTLRDFFLRRHRNCSANSQPVSPGYDADFAPSTRKRGFFVMVLQRGVLSRNGLKSNVRRCNDSSRLGSRASVIISPSFDPFPQLSGLTRYVQRWSRQRRPELFKDERGGYARRHLVQF